MNKISEAFITSAKRHLDTAHSYYYSQYPETVEMAQKAVELSIKALLREYVGDYPEEHELSRVLYDSYEKFPLEVRERIARLATISRTMEAWRLPSIYGRKQPEITPAEIFSDPFVEFSYKVAEEAYNTCRSALEQRK